MTTTFGAQVAISRPSSIISWALRAEDLGVDGAIDEVTYLQYGGAQVKVAGLGGEGRVSGNAGDDAVPSGFPDLFDVCGVEPNLHSYIPIIVNWL